MPLRLGVLLVSTGPQAGRLVMVDMAHLAEDLGFESVWVDDGLAAPDVDAGGGRRVFEPLVTLSYLAASTTRLRLGISSLLLPLREPVLVARQVAALDALSGGRTLLAVDAGSSEAEFAALGQDFSNRYERLEEELYVVRALWQGGAEISYPGKYYHFEGVYFSPTPVQPGGTPLWIGGSSQAALQRAARLGDGWQPGALSPQALSRALASIRPQLGERPFTVSLRLGVALDAADTSQADLAGSTQEVASQLHALWLAGMNHAVLCFYEEYVPARLRAMRRFQGEVLPAFEAICQSFPRPAV
jgi:probable F420-dependent oxidoreductase